MQPDRGLTTCQMHGGKKGKARIAIIVTVSGDGSEREPLWIIGVAGNPRCFKNINHDTLECNYCSSRKAWMGTSIFIEYLERLNRRMFHRKRNIALLLDSFSACHSPSLEDYDMPVATPPSTSSKQPTTHPGPLSTVVIGEHGLSLKAYSVQDLKALAVVDLLWGIRSGGEEGATQELQQGSEVTR